MRIKNIIKKIEEGKYPFLTGCVGLFCIITVRNIFESAFEGTQVFGFSPFTAHSFYMIFSHFLLFYVSIFLWFLVIFNIATRERITKIVKPLLIGLWIIVITPFVDIVISRGSGYKLTYLKGVEEFAQLHLFFDFTKDLLQASWGQRLEILLVLVGAFIYVCVKTKNILKSLITSVIFYLIIFFHGALPNTIARIPSYLGFDKVHFRTLITGGVLGIDSQNYSIIFLISIVIAGLLLIRKWKKEFFNNILNFKASIPMIIAAVFGIVYAIFLIKSYYVFLFYSPILYLIFFIAILSIHCATLTSSTEISSEEFMILLLFVLFSSLAMGPIPFIMFLFFLALINLTGRTRSTSKIPLATIICSLLAFVIGHATVFQDATFRCLVPSKRAEIYGRRVQAWDYFLNRNYAEALKEYRIVNSEAQNENLRKRIGQACLNLGDIDNGIRILESIRTPDYETILSLGQVYVQKGENEKATVFYDQAIENKIEPAEFLTMRAEMAARQGSRATDSLLSEALKYGAPKYRFYEIMGDYFLRTGEGGQALEMYNKALEYNKRSARAYAGRGMLYYNRGDLSKSQQEFLRALDFEPNNDGLHNNLGAIYLVEKDYAAARRHFEKSLNINPLQAEAYYNLGLIEETYGREEGALLMYKRALEINPYFSPARSAIDRMQAYD